MTIDMIPYLTVVALVGVGAAYWIWCLLRRADSLQASVNWGDKQTERWRAEIVSLKAHISALEQPADARQTMVMEPEEPTHYIRKNSSGDILVEKADHFPAWNEWGPDWIPVVADSIEDARAKAPEAWRERG